MTTTEQTAKDRNLAKCMERLERKLDRTGFDETEKQRIRDRESERWHLINDDVPVRYFEGL